MKGSYICSNAVFGKHPDRRSRPKSCWCKIIKQNLQNLEEDIEKFYKPQDMPINWKFQYSPAERSPKGITKFLYSDIKPVDYTHGGIIGPAQNQGNCGSCWAQSTVLMYQAALNKWIRENLPEVTKFVDLDIDKFIKDTNAQKIKDESMK